MNKAKPFLISILLISLVSLCGSVDQSQPTARTIEIKDFPFQPNSISVPVGTTATWINHDSVAHTITSDDGKFDSGTIESGGEFKFTFSQPGSYGYYCKIHPSMKGEVMITMSQLASNKSVVLRRTLPQQAWHQNPQQS